MYHKNLNFIFKIKLTNVTTEGFERVAEEKRRKVTVYS